ncbi:uncharacterized protein LOC110100090 [Dendrobium catenatum]|uniref:uncharacterized protein LOC110100090 n=1 Tax=Dendrobium catenatum TaxID=906689 RepID=UPI0009F24204|nr:uncharacterized protein LOC110100090 [Dendrobium catenatum]
MWLLHESFLDLVQNNWNAPLYPDNSISSMKRLWLKLKCLKMVLNWWNHNVFKNLFTNILLAENKINSLEELYQSDSSEANLGILNEAKVDLAKLQVQEETYWIQKAAIKHLVDGDKNTKYFHGLVNRKRSKNIHKISCEDGSITENRDEIASLAINYFHKHLNKSLNPVSIDNTAYIPNIISQEDNSSLSRPPVLEEIKNTLFEMNTILWLGLVLSSSKKTWPIIFNDVFSAVTDFFNGAPIPKFFTATYIVLIPKNNDVNS